MKELSKKNEIILFLRRRILGLGCFFRNKVYIRKLKMRVIRGFFYKFKEFEERGGGGMSWWVIYLG